MEEFIPNDPEIADSGSHFLPVFCGWIQGKHNARGKKAIIKINGHFYEFWITNKGKKWWGFRCGKHRNGCGFKLRIKPIEKDLNHSDFWKRDNWVIMSGSSPEVHTCESLSESELTYQQYNNFVRENVQEGITDYETIRIKSKIEAFKFGNIHAPNVNELYQEQFPNAFVIME